MKRFKEMIAIMKKLYANKRTRAAIVLLFYMVFLITVITVFKMGSDTAEVIIDQPLERYGSMTNYEYTMTLNENTMISGKRFANKELITFNNINYFYKDNVLVGFPFSEIDITKLRVDYIYNYLTTDNSVTVLDSIKTYTISLANFMKIANNVDIVSDKNIAIKTYMVDDSIVQVDLNLTEYTNYNAPLYNKYEVVIKYTNLNQVLDFNNN